PPLHRNQRGQQPRNGKSNLTKNSDRDHSSCEDGRLARPRCAGTAAPGLSKPSAASARTVNILPPLVLSAHLPFTMIFPKGNPRGGKRLLTRPQRTAKLQKPTLHDEICSHFFLLRDAALLPEQ